MYNSSMNSSIVFEDNDLIVLNKASGMTVNRADTTKDEITVQDEVEEYLHLPKDALMHEREYGDDFVKRGGIVHRLDKETSGVLLIAKTPEAFYGLQSQFKERTVVKSYVALVHGVLSPDSGEVNAPIGRTEWNRKRFGVTADGREAKTEYTTVHVYMLKEKKGEALSFLQVLPKTGRTHQIRVHMKYLGHPLFSDVLYAGRRTARDDRKYLERIFLHAEEITFTHPTTDERITKKADLPSDLTLFIENSLVMKS